MPERIPAQLSNTEQSKREALLLGRNPFVKEALEESQFVLQKTFGFRPDQFDLTSQGVSFISSQDRLISFVNEVSQDYFVLGEFRSRRIMPKEKYFPHVQYWMVKKDKPQNPASIFMMADPFGRLFKDSTDKPSDQSYPSRGAILLFRNLAEMLIDELTPAVQLEVDSEVLKELGRKALGKIVGMAENTFDPKLRKLTEEIKAKIDVGDGLTFQAKGARAELMLNGRLLDSYYEDEQTLLEFMFIESPEDDFKRRLGSSKVKGKKWFMPPEKWPADDHYRDYYQTDFYSELKDLIAEKGNTSTLSLLLGSQMVSILLERDGVSHTRKVVVKEPVVIAEPPLVPKSKPIIVVSVKPERKFSEVKKVPQVNSVESTVESIILQEAEVVEIPKNVKLKREKKNTSPPPKPQIFKRKKRETSYLVRENQQTILQSNPVEATIEEVPEANMEAIETIDMPDTQQEEVSNQNVEQVAVPQVFTLHQNGSAPAVDQEAEVGQVLFNANGSAAFHVDKSNTIDRRNIYRNRARVERDALRIVDAVLADKNPGSAAQQLESLFLKDGQTPKSNI